MTFTTHTTISNDGTRIGYRQIGDGPGLIICHGGGRISQNYEKLATALSDTFGVFIPDRRGRGLSGEEGENYNIKKATEDLTAVIQATSADFIFGHSAGDDVPKLNIIQENASVFTEPGEVVFGPEKPSRSKTTNCFGIYYGEGKGLDACNVFAKVVDSDKQKLIDLGNNIWKNGSQKLTVSKI